MAINKNPLNQLSINNYIALLVLASIIAVTLGVIVGRGLIQQAIINNKVISAKTKADKQLEANLAAIPELENNYDELGTKARLIMNSLPITPDYPAILSQVEVLVASSGNKLRSITPVSVGALTPAATKAPSPYQLTLVVDGNYDSIQRLLRNIEISARPLQVTSLNLSGSTGSMNAQVQLTTYYQGAADLKSKLEVVK